MLSAKEIIDWFDLTPHESEGGYLGLVYSSEDQIPNEKFNYKINGQRNLCSAIYYLLEKKEVSIMHRVKGDLIYHFYSGHPVEMLLLYPERHRDRYEICTFSNDVSTGGQPMKIIPGGTWMGTRVLPGGEYAFMGVTMSPGFHPEDYEIGDRKMLVQQYPGLESLIVKLTKDEKDKVS